MSLVLYLYVTCIHTNLCVVLMNRNYILLDFSQSSWPVHLRMLVFVLSNEVSWLDFPITVQCDIPLLANASGTSLNALSICYGSINYVCSYPWFNHRHCLKTLVAVYKVFKIKDHKAFDLGGGWGWKRILGWKSFLRQKFPTLNYFKSTQQVGAIRMWGRTPQYFCLCWWIFNCEISMTTCASCSLAAPHSLETTFMYSWLEDCTLLHPLLNYDQF